MQMWIVLVVILCGIAGAAAARRGGSRLSKQWQLVYSAGGVLIFAVAIAAIRLVR